MIYHTTKLLAYLLWCTVSSATAFKIVLLSCTEYKKLADFLLTICLLKESVLYRRVSLEGDSSCDILSNYHWVTHKFCHQCDRRIGLFTFSFLIFVNLYVLIHKCYLGHGIIYQGKYPISPLECNCFFMYKINDYWFIVWSFSKTSITMHRSHIVCDVILWPADILAPIL